MVALPIKSACCFFAITVLKLLVKVSRSSRKSKGAIPSNGCQKFFRDGKNSQLLKVKFQPAVLWLVDSPFAHCEVQHDKVVITSHLCFRERSGLLPVHISIVLFSKM